MKKSLMIMCLILTANTSSGEGLEDYPNVYSMFRLEKSLDLLLVMKMCSSTYDKYLPENDIAEQLRDVSNKMLRMNLETEMFDEAMEFNERLPKILGEMNELIKSENVDIFIEYNRKCSNMTNVKSWLDFKKNSN